MQAFEKGMCILENVYRGGIEAGNWLQWSQLTDGGWTQASSRPINAAAWLTVLLQTERWSLSDFTEFTFNVSLCIHRAHKAKKFIIPEKEADTEIFVVPPAVDTRLLVGYLLTLGQY